MDLVAKWWPGEAGMQHTLVQQLGMFERKEREFSKDVARWAKKQLLACRKMTPAMWWRMYGRHVSGLAGNAVKALSQPITSSTCTCCFSLECNPEGEWMQAVCTYNGACKPHTWMG